MIEIRTKVGARGQVVIPKPIREAFNILPGERVSFRVEDDDILLRKEDGTGILERLLGRFQDKEAEPTSIDWDEMHYSQLEACRPVPRRGEGK